VRLTVVSTPCKLLPGQHAAALLKLARCRLDSLWVSDIPKNQLERHWVLTQG
jgi:hypothetical protein